MAKRSAEGSNRSNSAALYVGIDLGTSRSAVCASNGVRKTIESIVGWPRDIVARRLIGKPVVFGEENHRFRLSIEQVRPLQRGVIYKGADRGEEAARELVRHLIELAEPALGDPTYAVIGAPSRATDYDKQAIRDALSDRATSAMIVSEPFTVAYALGLLDRAIIVDMGAGTTDLCRMHGTIPGDADQLSVSQAGDAIDHQLQQLLAERFPKAKFSIHMVRGFKEKAGFVGAPKERVIVTMPVAGRPTDFDITESMQRACESILPYLKEALRSQIADCNPEFQEQYRQNIVLAGGTSQLQGLGAIVQQWLVEMGGGKVSVVDDPIFAGAAGALAIAMDTPSEDWSRLRSEPDLVL